MTYRENYEFWRNSPALSPEERAELAAIAEDEKEIESRFFGPLEFGTAGLRGVMGVGLRRMNLHVIRHATQAFAQVILEQGEAGATQGIAICHDCRNLSPEFAREAACVMAANGIRVYLFSSMRPTPELSFAVRHYGCMAGINVTASHNPKEYNGYKVYWSDGAQLPPDHAAAIAGKMTEIDLFAGVKTMAYERALDRGLITLIGRETDEKYLAEVMAMANDFDLVKRVADDFTVVYTPFHGTGYQQVPWVLGQLGVKNLYCVEEQMVIDGNFPTVASPNPENPDSFALAIALAQEKNADLIMGTDPDADRVGILARNAQGQYQLFSGNQTGVLALHYLIGALERSGAMPPNPVALKTIVTTELARRVCERFGVSCQDTFTGFKFMAERKNDLEEKGEGKVIFSYEESFGYMLGDYVRDKDAVTASLLLAEMAAYYKDKGMTLFDAQEAIFAEFGYHQEETMNLVMPGLEGMENMKAIMVRLREEPLVAVADIPVLTQKDYQSGVEIDWETKTQRPTDLKGSNVLKYRLGDGTDFIVRPSGTEPKIKVYILAHGEDRQDCQARVAKIITWVKEHLK